MSDDLAKIIDGLLTSSTKETSHRSNFANVPLLNAVEETLVITDSLKAVQEHTGAFVFDGGATWDVFDRAEFDAT